MVRSTDLGFIEYLDGHPFSTVIEFHGVFDSGSLRLPLFQDGMVVL